jgi:uncharacterized protein
MNIQFLLIFLTFSHCVFQEEQIMNSVQNSNIVLEVFDAVEQRDEAKFEDLIDPEFEIHWPQSLPYGGVSRGKRRQGRTWSETWQSLQPTDAERTMDPHVVSASGNDVVVLWRQRGVNTCGDRYDGEVLGMYQIKNKKLARAQMFYFDTVAVLEFLKKTEECLKQQQ